MKAKYNLYLLLKELSEFSYMDLYEFDEKITEHFIKRGNVVFDT